ncbi:related to MTW1-component of the MIND kinetochore complex [Sporisorium reilianum SRZ2]|uniref:Related to MTW1-component of the MIND kinetochore complex n=1 Tax=Sporisorium reilianum (strain SRZ2) TaxID=999809 RepID=E6ZNC6_SPORE|nr:related to MTW1-component of the MIND kinetochore complex [Sporisorium reilianum SRZ2]
MPASRRSSQPAAAAAAPTASSSSEAKDTAATTSTIPSTSAAPASSAEAGPSTSSKQQSDKREEASTDAHLELLTEHFGYNPKSFIDALVYLSNEHLYSIATEFENVVMDLLKDVDGGELEAEQGMHAILTLMENSLDHTLDTFELYCFRSVFGIRSRQAKYMTLDHHRGLDLRTKQASSSKSQPKPAKSSLVGASSSLSANERSYQLGETEDSLKRQIAAARATQHKLLLAQSATQESLDRMLSLADRFSSVLYDNTDTKSAVPVLTETLGQHARKLKADTIPLLKALRELRSADPLGAPLYSGSGGGAASKDAGDAEGDDDAVADVRAWERGREGYLNWEADRIIAKSKRGGAGATTSAAAGTANVEADATLGEAAEDDSKTPKRKRMVAGQPTSSKRRTPGTASRSRG